MPVTPVVRTEQHGSAWVMTLDRPRVRNAIDRETAAALDVALKRLDADPELKVGILTGTGGTFCSGVDLKEFAVRGLPVVADRGLAGLTRACPRAPLIAAVEGAALGGGCELVLACDLIVASESAVFALPEVALGLVAAEGGTVRLPTRLPHHLAMEMILTGRRLDAPTAARYGLVNRLVPDGTALEAALGLATEVSTHAVRAVETAKQIVHATRGLDDPAAFRLQDSLAAPLYATRSEIVSSCKTAER